MDFLTFAGRLCGGFLMVAGVLALSAVTRVAGEAPLGERPVDTDPANFVEGPFTLVAGRSQIEWGALAYSRNRVGNFREEHQTVSALVLRTALSNHLELQVFHDGHGVGKRSDQATGDRESAGGLGDTTLQLKRNFLGNDRGAYALGATAFAVLNTGDPDMSAGRTIVGGSVVFAATVAEGRAGSLSAHSQLRYEHMGSADILEVGQSLIGARNLDEKNSLAVEVCAHRSNEAGAKWAVLSSLTFTHAFIEHLALDLAVTAGLNRDADDYGGFIILTRWF